MGRKPIIIEPLPDSQVRAKFKKRKLGLIKKAYELGTLCGAQVALIIFSKDGEEVIDKGYNGSTVEIIQRYWNQVHWSRNQQVPALQLPQFQPNSDSSSTMGPCVGMKQEVGAMDPNLQHYQYGTNPQVQHDQFGTNPQVKHEQFSMNPNPQVQHGMNPQVQQDRFGMNSQVQHDQFGMNPQVQQDQFGMNSNPQVQHDQHGMNSNLQVQHNQFMDPHVQQDYYKNSQMHQEVPATDPRMQHNQFGRQQLMTGISQQMQPGIPYPTGTNIFVDSSGNLVQDMMEGNQQFHGQQGHQTQFQNPSNVGYDPNNHQPLEPGFCN